MSSNFLNIFSWQIFGPMLYYLGTKRAGIAQLVEQLICNQQVGGSSPSTSSKK